MIAEATGHACHYGPIDTNHSGASTGRAIADAIRAKLLMGKSISGCELTGCLFIVAVVAAAIVIEVGMRVLGFVFAHLHWG